MAPLPPNSTQRLFFDYVTGFTPTSREHTVMVRFDEGGSAGIEGAMERFAFFLDALGQGSFADGWSVIRARYSARGTDFSNPVPLPPDVANFQGTGGPISPTSEAIEGTFQGRSQSSKRRVDLSLYGLTFAVSNNFRIEGGVGLPAQLISAAAAELNNASVNGVFIPVDGSTATWYDYLNQNFNSYWERRLRIG